MVVVTNPSDSNIFKVNIMSKAGEISNYPPSLKNNKTIKEQVTT
jgi:hypothetical protein